MTGSSFAGPLPRRTEAQTPWTDRKLLIMVFFLSFFLFGLLHDGAAYVYLLNITVTELHVESMYPVIVALRI